MQARIVQTRERSDRNGHRGTLVVSRSAEQAALLTIGKPEVIFTSLFKLMLGASKIRTKYPRVFDILAIARNY